MIELKPIGVITLVLGILSCIYGFSQLLPFGAESYIYEQILLKRTIKGYVFLSVGGTLLFLSYIVNKIIDKAIRENLYLLGRIADLEQKIENLNIK